MDDAFAGIGWVRGTVFAFASVAVTDIFGNEHRLPSIESEREMAVHIEASILRTHPPGNPIGLFSPPPTGR